MALPATASANSDLVAVSQVMDSFAGSLVLARNQCLPKAGFLLLVRFFSSVVGGVA